MTKLPQELTEKEPSPQIPLNGLDEVCCFPLLRLIIAFVLITLLPKIMPACTPCYIGAGPTIFFFLIIYYCIFAELYSIYFFAFKRRNLKNLLYTLLLPVEYLVYVIMCEQVGYFMRYHQIDF